MKKIRIIKNWGQDNLLKQTPGNKGEWGDYQFHLDSINKCDYLLILNHPLKKFHVECPKENVWAVNMEPPVEQNLEWQHALGQHQLIITTDTNKIGKKYYHSQPAIPWFVDRDYDYLTAISPPKKTKTLSWITSTKTTYPGHKDRLNFLNKIKNQEINIELFGRGIAHIHDKWDALENYRYSIAIENYQGLHYWTEKLADCFLAWTMPIYYGCTNISDYFPQESYISIDINSPDAFEIIEEAIRSDLWIKNRDAISYSRELILNKYQLFPFITNLIDEKISRSNKPENINRPIRLTYSPHQNNLQKFRKNIAKKISTFLKFILPIKWRGGG